MNIIKKLMYVAVIAMLASGCATKIIDVKVPQYSPVETIKGYVKIEEVNDLRKFERSPSDPAIPSVEGDLIDDKGITDKVIGRMRHGLYHKSLWNYTIKGDDDIYDVCRKVVTGSLAGAGYVTVAEGDAGFDSALPIAIDILQFWAWMQPKFNIDLNFDGEIRIRSMAPEKTFDVNASGAHMFSTGFAGGGAWSKLVAEGVKDLDKNLVLKLKGVQD